jgi:UDP-N-acetylmuramyl pentapeptide phosphotransferase/UDP-N-acetylglucosamine-1-phosphate transferase
MSWLIPLASFAVCWLVLRQLLRSTRLPMDHPNARSLHATPTPRVGGLGIIAGVIVSAIGLAAFGLLDSGLLAALLGMLALAAVSVLDDVRNLSVRVRFGVHFLVALGCLLAFGVHGWLLIPGVLAVVWMTNLYNFMDGSDGLAGGMASIGFGALALAAWLAHAPGLALLCAAIAAAALAFLRFNFPPARLFMGDAGSIPLGFLAAVLGMLGTRDQIWAWYFPLLVFSPFIVDASVTLLRRALRGEKIWHAHREHYYQRLVRMGWQHRTTALAEYAVMVGSSGMALISLFTPAAVGLLIALAWVAVLLVTMGWIDRRWRKFEHAAQPRVT